MTLSARSDPRVSFRYFVLDTVMDDTSVRSIITRISDRHPSSEGKGTRQVSWQTILPVHSMAHREAFMSAIFWIIWEPSPCCFTPLGTVDMASIASDSPILVTNCWSADSKVSPLAVMQFCLGELESWYLRINRTVHGTNDFQTQKMPAWSLVMATQSTHTIHQKPQAVHQVPHALRGSQIFRGHPTITKSTEQS